MKDQPTEASVDPFNMHRLRGPPARFHQLSHTCPLPVEQGKGMVQRQRIRGVFGERMKGENEDKTCLRMGHCTGTAKGGFQQRVVGHAAVGVPTVGWVEDKACDLSNPLAGENIREPGGVAAFDGGMFGVISTVCPKQVGVGTLHHFGMNVDADGVPSAQ